MSSDSHPRYPGFRVDGELKIWPGPLREVLDGGKRFEVREVPERFEVKVGRVIELREWDPLTETYSGCSMLVRVGFVCDHEEPSPLPEGLVVFGIHPLAWGRAEDGEFRVLQSWGSGIDQEVDDEA